MSKRTTVQCIGVLLIFLISALGVLALIGGATGQASVATVAEREGYDYEVTMDPDEKAKFKWDILNPTNITYFVSINIMSDNVDFEGTVDHNNFQVFAGQSDVVILKVSSDAEGTDKAKFTLVFTLRNTVTDENITAYKSATVKVVVTHGIDFHGLFVLNPESIGLDDNDYTRILMIILTWILIACLTLFILNPVVRFAVRKTKTKIDDVILEIIAKPIFLLVILYGLLDAVALMEFIPKDFASILGTLFGLAVLLIIMYLAFKLFKGVLIQFGKEFAAKTETEVDDVLIPVVEKIGTVFIGIFGLMGVLSYFGVNLTMAAAGFGVFGLVIAFAAQSSIANFFGGIFILLDRPFKVDDLILIDNDYCRVEHIGLRSTRVYNIFDHDLVIIPNDKLANSTVINLSAPDTAYKVTVTFGVAYGTDPDSFVEKMLDIAKGAPEEVGIIKDDPDRGMWCRLNELKDSSMDFKIGFWVVDLMKQWGAAGYVRTKLYYLCEKEGIEIPFPQMEVMVKERKQT